MNRPSLALLLVVAPIFAAGCGGLDDILPDLTLGKEDGIPPVTGSTVLDVPPDFKCGSPINDPNGKYTVTTTGTQESCTFVFKQDVTALKASDYSGHPELEGARLVKRVDMAVNKFGVKDEAGMDLSPLDLTGKAFGSVILTKEDLARKPPFTKSIEGAPLDALKDAVGNKRDVVIPVEITVVVSLAPTTPAKVGLDFDAQPNLVFGF